MQRLSIVVSSFLFFALVACKSHDQGNGPSEPPLAGSSADAAPAPSPAKAPPTKAAEARAREFLQHQVDSAKAGDNKLIATFTPDAIVVVADRSGTPDEIPMFGIGDAGPDGVVVTKAAITKLVAGGNADATWFYAEVTIEGKGPNGQASTPAITRVVELIVASEQWRAVAASFGSGGKLQASGNNREIENATAADGPLAKLLASTTSIAAQLAPDAIVVGPQAAQFATGADAKAALVGWNLDPLTLFKRAREVRKPSWGFVQGHFDHPDPKDATLTDRVMGQAFAIAKPDGSWSIVLVQYDGR